MQEVFSIPVIYLPSLFNMVHCESRNMNHCYFKKCPQKEAWDWMSGESAKGLHCDPTATGDMLILSSVCTEVALLMLDKATLFSACSQWA